MLANFFGVEFYRIVSKFRKRKRKCLFFVPVLNKTWNWALSRFSRATTAKKCAKKRDACAKLLFCKSKPVFGFCRSHCRLRRRCLSSLLHFSKEDRGAGWFNYLKMPKLFEGGAFLIKFNRILCMFFDFRKSAAVLIFVRLKLKAVLFRDTVWIAFDGFIMFITFVVNLYHILRYYYIWGQFLIHLRA